jgi:release factor glutamine methyltransferase
MDWTQSFFAKVGIESARLDTEVLLAHVLKKERIFLYTHFDRPLSGHEREEFREMVKRRAQREPVAYILGEKEFYGRPFLVNEHTLIPRPETEHLIDGILKWEKEGSDAIRWDGPLKVLDIGTGTGCIGITLAAELGDVEVTAVDISSEALKMAAANAEALGVDSKILFLQGDLLSSVVGQEFHLIVSNPPYVEEQERDNLSPDVVGFEPGRALFAGDDGMDIIRRLIPGAALQLTSGGLFAMEFGSSQRQLVESCVGESWAHYWIEKDLQGHPRALFAKRS